MKWYGGWAILVSAGIFLLGLIVPWWASAPFFLLASYYFAPWIYGIAIALIYDIIFSIPRADFHNFQFAYTLFAIASVAFVYFAKRKILNV